MHAAKNRVDERYKRVRLMTYQSTPQPRGRTYDAFRSIRFALYQRLQIVE